MDEELKRRLEALECALAVIAVEARLDLDVTKALKPMGSGAAELLSKVKQLRDAQEARNSGAGSTMG